MNPEYSICFAWTASSRWLRRKFDVMMPEPNDFLASRAERSLVGNLGAQTSNS